MIKCILHIVCLTCILSTNAFALNEQSVTVDVLTKTTSSWNGETLPAYPNGQPEVTILKIEIPPKMKLPLHEHPVINAGVLLKGELTVVTTDNKTLHLKAGDPIVEVVDSLHYGINEGTEPAEIMVFYAGVKDKLITIKNIKDTNRK
ncbi:cupin [Desulfoplanes formicivorans]|uniref:Cupin n=1 Tax=Desulfoplanes formicivorans TaxID=1592317 RepID=A0A194AHD1_9BACT|nr:cupin [Desulfoplanes formicivorans]